MATVGYLTARTLANYPRMMIRIACRKCDRRGQNIRLTLIAHYGANAPLCDVLRRLTHDCPKRNASGNDTCGAYV